MRLPALLVLVAASALGACRSLDGVLGSSPKESETPAPDAIVEAARRQKAFEEEAALRARADEARAAEERVKRLPAICEDLRRQHAAGEGDAARAVGGPVLKEAGEEGRQTFLRLVRGGYVDLLGRPLLSDARLAEGRLTLYANQLFHPRRQLELVARTAELFFVRNGCAGDVEVRRDLHYIGQGERLIYRAFVDPQSGRGRVW